MQTFNILPNGEGSWKAVRVGGDALVISYDDREKLITIMVLWAEKSGDPILIRIHDVNGGFEEERTYG